jgi:hypothetical protein
MQGQLESAMISLRRWLEVVGLVFIIVGVALAFAATKNPRSGMKGKDYRGTACTLMQGIPQQQLSNSNQFPASLSRGACGRIGLRTKPKNYGRDIPPSNSSQSFPMPRMGVVGPWGCPKRTE